MAPKKKGKKQDDWESELGETPDPIAVATQEAKDADAAIEPEEAEVGGGGLLAALKKNKSNKKKKGKPVEDDYVDGEDPPVENGMNGHTDGIESLATKAPAEATTEDMFAEQVKKTTGSKGKQGKKESTLQPNEDGEGNDEDGGTVKSKKEKEKEKKEREKQRKKEQVSRKDLIIFTAF